MLSNNEYIGLTLEGDTLKIAHVAVDGKKIRLIKLDQTSLVDPLEPARKEENVFAEEEAFGEELDADSIFGLEDDLADSLTQEPVSAAVDEEISFDELTADTAEGDLLALDMAEEAGTPQTNQILLFNILSGIDSKKINLGINVPAGNTMFQIIRDTDFNEVKTKDLVADIEEKLESIYGIKKSKDNYAYEVKEDGSLLLASVDQESPLLVLLNEVLELYSGKITIGEVIPDEAALVGLVRTHYELPDYEITAVIQFGSSKCRIVFMQGQKILLVSPLINEGTKNKSFLNTVFSKILFQLDTGEVPNLDRIIIANNTLGEDAIRFFKKSFSDIPVSEFQFSEEKFDLNELDPETVHPFTTAIGLAWAASGLNKEAFPKLSLIPAYVYDRQKIFKLQWHGVLLLLLIFISPITINYFYQQNADRIAGLSSELQSVNIQISQINPLVESTNQLSEDLSLLREKLVLLDTLSKGSREWSAKLNILNEGMSDIGNTWLTDLRPVNDGMYIGGYTLYRNRIPQVVDIFDQATLLNVSIQEEREKEIFNFSIVIKEFAEDPLIYSPAVPDGIQEILTN